MGKITEKRLLEIRQLMEQVESIYACAFSYFGGTFPSHIDTDKGIRWTDRFVWVTVDGRIERYLRKDEFGELAFTLRYIKAGCQKALRGSN